jgi:hypothetical protein
MSVRLAPDLEARQIRRECLVWLDGIGAAAGATQPLEADVRAGCGVEPLIALIHGECFFVECLASRQVHHRRSHEHQQTRFRVQHATCLSVRSARELELLVRDYFYKQRT